MAVGALIGGSVLKGIGAKKQKDAAKQSARAQREANEKMFENVSAAVERSREIEKDRTAAESIADAALKEANEAFLDANAQKYKNSQIDSKNWASANRDSLSIEMGNIALGAQEKAEQIKRQARSNEIYEGRANVRSKASGFGGGSSLDKWVDTIQETNSSDLAWMKHAASSSTSLATQDANLKYRVGEQERISSDRADFLGYQTGEAQYDFYESQREADAAMRDVARQEREADREFRLAEAEAGRDAGNAQAKAGYESAKGGFYGQIGSAVGGLSDISSSYKQFGWGV